MVTSQYDGGGVCPGRVFACLETPIRLVAPFRERQRKGYGYNRRKFPTRAVSCHAFRIVNPPSTGITAPVRYEAAGRHKLKVICATSSG
jgi:hypothetical protein